MNILELDSYRLADAVKFHNRLNPRLWSSDEHLHPEVRKKLLEIAADFQEFLGIDALEVEDITISGSNAAYSYTPHSDIDLHLVVRKPEMADQVYQELFNAKKYQYNDLHNIRIRGADVELYVQSADETPVSLGEYSIAQDQWLQVPRRKRARIDQSAARQKYDDLRNRIDSALKDGDSDRIQALIDKIKIMRKTGLDQHGEFGVDNIVYKVLRTQGHIQRLYDAQAEARDQELSLQERKRKKNRVRYGFGGYWAPGFAFGDSGGDGGGGESVREASTPDGVSPSTKMFLSETDTENIVQEFIKQTAQRLGIKNLPTVHLHSDPEWSAENHSFGMYQPESHELYVNLHNRHILDILRTTAHELVHCRQNEIEPLDVNAGDTGSKFENEAHAVAGVIMRDYAETHPEIFDDQPVTESSGYIPTEAQKNDPRFVMALTADVRPGATGLNANRMALNTDSQGRPQLLRANGQVDMVQDLAESLRSELAQLDGTTNTDHISARPRPSRGDGRRREINAPLGPETPPTMPAGTVRVDVSDMYDWYKLGQHISNMKGLGQHDFGAGPPSSIISFGDEETEHKYIKDLEATGLTTTDIDPVDPKQPAGMKRQKTDPTYNVAEQDLMASLHQEFELLEDEMLGEIKMSPTNLRAEAAKTGAIAGMEFEMIVPGMESEDPEQEPDYDQDERCRSIDDAVNFFHDGDYNSRREVERLRERMQNDFYEWLDDKLYQDWERNGEEYLEEWVPNNVDESEWNPDSLEGEARQEALEVFIANMHADPGSSDAFDEFREESAYDESDWLDAEDLDRMSGVENAYQITWPYWTMINSGEVDTDQVADEFSQAVGREVRVNTRYHQAGARPDPSNQFYVVEPDASLRGDDDSDKGLEFVSPPMPIDELLKDLNAIKAWAGRMGVYTNSSTGLHINISVPNYSRENLDFVKLALLMGDEYVLDQFGRSSNTYAKSALKIVKDNIRQSSGSAEALLTKMRGHMKDLATKAIHSGYTDKFTSINTKDGHIEFRSPGGDWLDENFDKIETTLLRFTVAMSAALNPEAYREEYQKKLYKLLTRDNKGDDTIKYFSDYVAGKIPKAALRSFVKQAQLDRKVKRGETGNQKMWWSVGRPGYFASVNVVASSKEEAIAKGKAEYPDWASARDMTANPLRPYEETPAQPAEPQGGNWGIWMRAADRFARVPGQTDLNVLLRFPSSEAAEQWIAQRRIENPNMRSDIEVREIEPAVQNTTRTDTGQIGIPGSTLDLQRQRRAAQSGIIDIEPNVSQNPPQSTEAPPGNQFSGQWKVVDGAGREVYRFRGVGNNQADANRIASTWARENSYTGALDVLPVMI